MSEILPEISTVILPDIMLNDVKKLNSVTKSLADINVKVSEESSIIVTADSVLDPASIIVESSASKEPSISQPGMSTLLPSSLPLENKQEDFVEQDLMAKLEELKKEKSRLFSLFRVVIEKKEQTPPIQPLQPTDVSPNLGSNSVSTLPSVAEEEPQFVAPTTQATTTPLTFKPTDSLRETTDRFDTDKGNNNNTSSNYNTEPKRKFLYQRRQSDQEYDKRAELPSRPNFKRREHDRMIDRSKLNLEIPRKPSVPSSASASSNSTASTPTPTSAAFSIQHFHHHPYQSPFSASSSSSSNNTFIQKGKRQRSNSPPLTYGSAGRLGGDRIGDRPGGESGRSSGPSSFGPPYSDSTPSNKYPRADYNTGPHGRNHSSGSNSNSGNGGNNHNSFNGLPEKPQIRHNNQNHHNNNHHHNYNGNNHNNNNSNNNNSNNHGSDDGYQRIKHGNGSGPASSSFSNMNSNNNNNGGGNRQGGHIGYPPPTRIGFGNTSNSNSHNNSHNSNNNALGNGSNGIGGNHNSNSNSNAGNGGNSGRGYYGHGNDNDGPPISKFGPPPPPPTRPVPPPFHRNMGPMSHPRGMTQGRNGFGGGRPNGSGGGDGGGLHDRSISSGRPGDWSRRRSRV
ncbi:hypothetical protein BGZ76_004778 [Entomortierella beljakovae]|nr:hypothetical protein BGZ76_004778 [Entomortierella beljakovae]